MDDLMGGADSVSNAINIQRVIHKHLLTAGMKLRKYQSNSDEFLNHIDPSLIETMEPRSIGTNPIIHVLGLIW